MTDKIVVLSTSSSIEEAEKIARVLLEERLAAGVNVLPGLRSFYRWKGAVEDSCGYLLLIKSSRGQFDKLKIVLGKVHCYAVPEGIALPIVDGSKDCLPWREGGI